MSPYFYIIWSISVKQGVILTQCPRYLDTFSPAMGSNTFNQVMLLKDLSNLALNCSSDEASTTSQGNTFEGLTTMIRKNFYLIFNLNLPSFGIKLLTIVLSLQTLVKSLSIYFIKKKNKIKKSQHRNITRFIANFTKAIYATRVRGKVH